MALSQPVTGTSPFQPRSPDYLQDPYARLREMRSEGACWVDPGSGQWFLLGFDEVEAGLSRLGRDPHPDARNVHFPGNPFASDGPGHTRARKVIMPAFLKNAVKSFLPRIRQIVDDALATKAGGGELRIVEEIGFPLPYHITRDILGIPDVENRDELRDWTWKSLELIDAFLTKEQLEENLAASACLAAHLEEVIEWKRKNLGDDIWSAVIQAADAGEVMRPEQVIPFIHTVYLAGMHTTVNQTALSLWALLQHRDQWELLRSKPELLSNAVDELLRFESTAQYMRRVGTPGVEIGGIEIPEGTDVVCWIASANRDEKRWGPTADKLDITRPDASKHVAFGKGPHVCIGSWLARLELEVIVGTILDRYPNTELPDQELVWSSNVIRGPEEVVLELRP
ncbi:MAG: cytochrome P450 [Deltaproteobacteria bacterium]|nr:cytochrome P450 [Deltaproteobacteria bacterium]